MDEENMPIDLVPFVEEEDERPTVKMEVATLIQITEDTTMSRHLELLALAVR